MTMQESLNDFIQLIKEAKKFVNHNFIVVKNVYFIMMIFQILASLRIRQLIGKIVINFTIFF